MTRTQEQVVRRGLAKILGEQHREGGEEPYDLLPGWSLRVIRVDDDGAEVEISETPHWESLLEAGCFRFRMGWDDFDHSVHTLTRLQEVAGDEAKKVMRF